MDFLRKHYKKVLGTLIILVLMELAVVYYLVNQFHEMYIRGPEALEAALADAGVSAEDVADSSVKLGHKSGKAWYNIRFEADGTVYVYQVDAENGEILSSGTE